MIRIKSGPRTSAKPSTTHASGLPQHHFSTLENVVVDFITKPLADERLIWFCGALNTYAKRLYRVLVISK